MENNTPPCPTCQAPLDDLGLCPRCLLAGAMAPTEAGQSESLAPSLEEISASFPDLEIIELIGKGGMGGMGAVFKCRQKSLDRFVALKILPQSLAADESFALRFQAEAKALATLNHPNIVTIHDFGHQGGFYFLLMEFVDGLNLRHLIRSRKLKPEEALAIIPPLCEALQFAHERQIVHRDIKPENLLLDSNGRIKIADFGIATIIGQADPTTERAAGTPAYMAPEQRANTAPVDARADIYSLGVVLYEMLTGERPDAALTPPSQKASLDVRIDEVVLRALSNQPEQRWQSATDFNTQLQTVLTPTTNLPPESSPKKAYWACSLTFLSFLILSLALLKANVRSESSIQAESFLIEQEHLLNQREQILADARNMDGRNLSDEEYQKAQASLVKQADEILAQTKALQPPKRPSQLVPILLTVTTLGLGTCTILTGLILGWRHLSWLRGQTPGKPALIPGLIASLLWPLLTLSGLIISLVVTPMTQGKWADAGFMLGVMSLICLNLWIICKTLAWTKNQAHPISRNVWLLTLPLITLAIFVPLSRYDLASQQKLQESKLRLNPPSHVQYLENELQKSLESHAKIIKSGLGPNHPNVAASKNRVAVFETELKSLGDEAYLASKYRVLSKLVTDFKAALTLMKLPRRLGSRRIQVARLGGADSALFGRGPARDCPVAKDRRGDGV